MEAYKSECPDCGAKYYWQGYKTGLGKTDEQLKGMRIKQTVCRHCGKENLNTTLDHESETGKEYDEMYKHIFSFVDEALSKRKDNT